MPASARVPPERSALPRAFRALVSQTVRSNQNGDYLVVVVITAEGLAGFAVALRALGLEERRRWRADVMSDATALTPPDWLNERQRESWARLLANAPRELGYLDAQLLATYAVAEDQYRQAALTQASMDRGGTAPMLTHDKAGRPIASPYPT